MCLGKQVGSTPTSPTKKLETMIEEDLKIIIEQNSRIESMLGRLLSERAEKAKPCKKYMDIKEASEYTSLAEQTLRIYCSQKKIEFQKIGGRIMIHTNSLDKFMSDGTVRTIDDKAKEVYNRLSH